MTGTGGTDNALRGLQQQIDYPGMEPDAVVAEMARLTGVVSDVFLPERRQQIEDRLSSAEVVQALLDGYECVRILVGTELDTVTPGERGLGRMTTTIPRFGGRFRDYLTPHWASQLGRVMEVIAIEGYASTVALDLLGAGPTSEIRTRPLDILFERWATHIGTATAGASQTFYGVMNAVSESTMGTFWILSSGMMNATRKKPQKMKKRDRHAVTSTGVFLFGAGFDLYWFSSSRTDDRFPG